MGNFIIQYTMVKAKPLFILFKNIFVWSLLLVSLSAFAQKDKAQEFYRQAKQYDSLGNIVKAAEYYTKTINADSTFANAYFNRGSILAQQKKYQEALSDFKSFDKINPNDNEAQYLMAACYYYLGSKNISLDLVNKSLKSKQDFFDALKLRGEIYTENGDYKEAIADFEKALTTKKDPELFSMIGVAYEGLEDNESAFKNYLTAEQLGYNHQLLYNNLGHLFSLKNDQNKALIYFNKAIIIDSTFAVCYYNRGSTFYDLGFKQSAIDDWKKAEEYGFTGFSEETKKLIH